MAASETVRLIWEDLTSTMRSAQRYLQERMFNSDPTVDRQEVVRLMGVQDTLASKLLQCRPLPGETEAVQLAKLRTVEGDIEIHQLRVFYV